MATRILMPKLGLTMKTGTVLKWLKDEGDHVDIKEHVLEIETEKLSHSIEAPAAGMLIRKDALIGEKYPVACVLGYIGMPGEKIDDSAIKPAPISTNDSPASLAAGHPPSTGTRIFISPVAKKLAASLGVDYRKIKGTGPNGRIIKADIERFSSAKKSSADILDYMPAEADTLIPYTGMRRAIGERMQTAWNTIPMVTHQVMADATALLEYRTALNAGVDDGEKVSINDLMLKLTAAALENMPIINSTLTDDGIIVLKRIHLGMATAVDGGLIVPVIRDANKKSLLAISKEAKLLAERARSGSLGFDDIEGGTFTVSNLGGYGSVEYFTPIINPPQAAILGIGCISKAAVPIGTDIVVRSRMGLSFTYDHRIIDGAAAAEFIKSIQKLLENPSRTMVS